MTQNHFTRVFDQYRETLPSIKCFFCSTNAWGETTLIILVSPQYLKYFGLEHWPILSRQTEYSTRVARMVEEISNRVIHRCLNHIFTAKYLQTLTAPDIRSFKSVKNITDLSERLKRFFSRCSHVENIEFKRGNYIRTTSFLEIGRAMQNLEIGVLGFTGFEHDTYIF